ncbi:MAG: LytTR family DNA-binding domain-containing protein [Pseudomonadota bacterium]
MKDSAVHLAKRELQQLIMASKFWIGLGAAVLALGLSGPFDTQDLMNFPERLVYWALTAPITFFIGIGLSSLVASALAPTGINEFLARILGGALAGLPITVFVWYSNIWLFGIDMRGFRELLLYCGGISMALTVLVALLQSSKVDIAPPGTVAPHNVKAGDAFFARLPVQLGRDLISLQAQDHYIRVVTPRGSHMLLMRLEDACLELENVPGFRTHRSWWVAEPHVSNLQREGARLSVRLSDGQQVPVSRTHQKRIRQWFHNKKALTA